MKAVVHSKQDQDAMQKLETQTIRTSVDGVLTLYTIVSMWLTLFKLGT